MRFPGISDVIRLERLQPPGAKIQMVLDTDACNEIDDQFALVYSLLSPERLDVKAIYAAPFYNSRSTSPVDGMEKSYEEIHRVLAKLGRSSNNFVLRGSSSYLSDNTQPVKSDAASDLVNRAMESRDSPLYVVSIAAITNIASAILMEPQIIERIVIIWLGGHALHWQNTDEFNLRQDLYASKLIFNCGVPLVQIPCKGVTTHLLTTVPEMERYVQGQGAIGDYLMEIFKAYISDRYAGSKIIWDMAPIAYLINETWVPTTLVHSPVVTNQLTWSVDPFRHLIRSATFVFRDPIFQDFFRKLSNNSGSCARS